MTWINRYASLGPAFSAEVLPSPVPEPYWVAQNHALQADYALPDDWLNTHEALAVFSGNGLWDGMASRATVYSGHQFGHWAGQLGDGRALALGEFQTSQGCFEVQLKGAGKTPFSRMGDGRAVLRSSIREYLCSEAMAALGIPTTRALCLTGSPLPVLREELETAAVVTRLAPSFIRFGHFEHFANQSADSLALQKLADFVLAHYLNKLNHNLGNPYADLLLEVSLRTAKLMAQWQAVGFCHGVMNTDNMSILGLTLDYGPFQFLDGFNPRHICNHTDSQGRYAYHRQPNVAYWNLFCLGQALAPLINDQDLTISVLESYKHSFPLALDQAMARKLGIANRELIDALLQLMAKEQVDYTVFWRRLSHAVAAQGKRTQAHEPAWALVRDLFLDRPAWDAWQHSYLQCLHGNDLFQTGQSMLAHNPKFVLRNHLAEIAIRNAKSGDFTEVDTLMTLLQSPFEEHAEYETYAQLPPAWASSIEISCSS